MRKRSSVEGVGAALLAALGLLGGCGGDLAGAGDGDGGAPNPNGLQSDSGTTPGDDQDAPSPAPSTSGTPSPAAPVCTEHPCLHPSPVVVGNVDTGYDTCQGGTLRRRAVVECPSLLPRPANNQCPMGAETPGQGCLSDAECTSQPNGYCYNCSCYFGCRRDSDCTGAGEVCVCGDLVGACTVAACTSGANCLPGCDCVNASPSGFACQTPSDECLSDGDCVAPPNSCGAACVMSDPPGHFYECRTSTDCATGRPFLVHGSERLAECVARADWNAANVAPDLQSCSASTRALLAAHWVRVGLMEHASIAAFARFTLHLLAVGAPPDLVSSSQQAIGDETEHARLSFALASAYAGAEMGPSALAIDGSLDGFDVAGLVTTLLREGCIGETIAAIEARDALDGVRDPVVRTVLETIARDELRHAELAWRTLGWLVATGRVNRAAVRDEVARALADMGRPLRRGETVDDLSAFGVVSEGRRDELRRAAATHVIAVCAAALLGREVPSERDVVRAMA